MGDPVILLDHEKNIGAEATLLADPEWRCVFYDAVGSVFLARRRHDLEAPYPRVDFAARHFADKDWHSAVPQPLGLAEGRSLLSLSLAIRHRSGSTRSQRLALALLACDRFRQVTSGDPTAAEPWSFLGDSCANLIPDLKAAPAGTDESWDPARGLLPAQAAFCYRQALVRDPGEIRALFSLYRQFQDRRMHDARHSVAMMMCRAWAEDSGGDSNGELEPGEPSIESPNPDIPIPDWDRLDREGLNQSLVELLRHGRPETAIDRFAEAERRGIVPSWSTCDRVAAALLLLGRPDEARRIWERARNSPSTALRSSRIATADLAALDFPAAEAAFRTALKHDPELGEAWFGLALLHTQRGDLAEALTTCRAGLRRPSTSPRQTFLQSIEALVTSLAPLERTAP